MILVIYHVTEIIRHRASTIALADISRSALCCHRNETCAPIANPPSSAQLKGTPTIPLTYIRVRAVVWECGEAQTDRHKDRHTDTDGLTQNATRHRASTSMYSLIFRIRVMLPW